MASEYLRQGHDVYLYTLQAGVMYKHCLALGVQQHHEDNHYDLILANHYPVIENLKHRKERIIQTVHGTIHKYEEKHPRADMHIAVSHEIAELKDIKIVIPNAVDLEKYSFVPYGKEKPSILCLCQGDLAANMCREIAGGLGYGFEWRSKNHKPIMDMPRLIAKHSIVVGAGRGIVEAMAMKRAVVVADSRSYQKPLINPVLSICFLYNYSGRGECSKELKTTTLLHWLNDARRDIKQVEHSYEHVKRHHDIRRNSKYYFRFK